VSKEIERQTFLDDVSFLRIRNLTLRCLAAAVDIACASENSSPNPKQQQQQQHQHNHPNNVGPFVNGEVKEDGIGVLRYETFVKISDELLTLYKSLTENPPAQVPQVRDKSFLLILCRNFYFSFSPAFSISFTRRQVVILFCSMTSFIKLP